MSESERDARHLVCFAVAADFAARRHARQRRKGADGEPYINHPAEVARLIAEATGGIEVVAIVAAWLHDTVEDTATTSEELETLFGTEVAAVVGEVTDDKNLPKDERKRLQIEHAASRSRAARLVKLANKTSNLRSIRTNPPVGWPVERRRAYFEWAKAVVDRIRGTHAVLESWFDQAYAEGVRALEEEGADAP